MYPRTSFIRSCCRTAVTTADLSLVVVASDARWKRFRYMIDCRADVKRNIKQYEDTINVFLRNVTLIRTGSSCDALRKQTPNRT